MDVTCGDCVTSNNRASYVLSLQFVRFSGINVSHRVYQVRLMPRTNLTRDVPPHEINRVRDATSHRQQPQMHHSHHGCLYVVSVQQTQTQRCIRKMRALADVDASTPSLTLDAKSLFRTCPVFHNDALA